MKKIFWVGIGIGIGVLAARRLASAKDMVGPDGLNRAVGRFADSLHDVADAFREGMNERETELKAALGVADAAGPHAPRH